MQLNIQMYLGQIKKHKTNNGAAIKIFHPFHVSHKKRIYLDEILVEIMIYLRNFWKKRKIYFPEILKCHFDLFVLGILTVKLP